MQQPLERFNRMQETQNCFHRCSEHRFIQGQSPAGRDASSALTQQQVSNAPQAQTVAKKEVNVAEQVGDPSNVMVVIIIKIMNMSIMIMSIRNISNMFRIWIEQRSMILMFY